MKKKTTAPARLRPNTNAALRVAVAQMEPVLGDVRSNVSAHLAWARRAAAAGADVVVFPELSLTGYLLQDLASEVAIPLDRPGPLAPLLRMSRSVAMIVGLAEESESHRVYNSALYLSGGRIRHVHRKVYLPTYGMFDEGRFFAAGDGFRAFDTPFGRLGLLICEDFWHTSASLVLAQDGADCLIVVSAGPTEGIDRRRGLVGQATWKNLARVIAQMQTLFVVYANRIGFEDGVNFAGGSCVVDPFGECVAEAPILREHLLVCDLPRPVLRRARALYPLLRDERLPVLAREVRRLMDAGSAAGLRKNA